jgi:hypothetical protein
MLIVKKVLYYTSLFSIELEGFCDEGEDGENNTNYLETTHGDNNKETTGRRLNTTVKSDGNILEESQKERRLKVRRYQRNSDSTSTNLPRLS